MPMKLKTESAFGSRSGKTAAVLAVVLLTGLAVAGLVYASEGGEPANTMDWIKKTVHFGALLAGVVFLYVKFGTAPLKKRIEGIENALADAKADKEEAIRKLTEVEERLKNKDQETQSIVDVATENGVKERERLIADGERMSQDIVESAKENIGAELVKAKEEIRREAAIMAIELAEKMVRENINKDDQARILEDYIAKVGG
jgi:F-type H+-transporting ATPase subunit b